MKIDPIAIAEKKVKLTDTLKKAETLQSQLNAAGKGFTPEAIRNNAAITSATNQLTELKDPKNLLSVAESKLPIKELPIKPDPELIKKEAMARAQTLRADAEQLLQQKKEEELNKLKQRVEQAAGPFAPALGLVRKLPIRNPKHLASLAYEKAKQKIIDAKQKASKENLKKAKEAFTFPMKPPIRLDLGETPKLETPNIPDIPTTQPLSNPIVPQTKPSEPTAPVRSKFTFLCEGGGGESFNCDTIYYDGRMLTITEFPIRVKFSPFYGYSRDGVSYESGWPSVKAYMQDSLLRGDFDRFVTAPF